MLMMFLSFNWSETGRIQTSQGEKEGSFTLTLSNWRDNKICELLLVRADAEIGRQVQGTIGD